MATVCTGLLLRGWERAGDILAAIDGVSRRSDVDASTLLLGGWSHGGWGIMEALSAERDRPGALGLADAATAKALCDAVKAKGGACNPVGG